MELIDKEKVIKEVKKVYDEGYKFLPSDIVENVDEFKDELLRVLDTLETKEVDLEKEIYDYFNEWQNVLCDEDCCNEGGFCCVLDENVKPVNIERCRKVAKHFFKLGINSK